MTDFSKYYTACRLDDAFNAALVKTFGENEAGNRRYDCNKTDWPDYLQEAHRRWCEASNTWFREIRG